MKILTNKHYLSRDPHVDWAVIFIVTCLLVIVFMFEDYVTYEEAISSVNDEAVQSAVIKLPFEQSALDEAVAVQVKHRENRTSIINSPVIVEDPSK